MRKIANLRLGLYAIAALLAVVGIGDAFVAGFFQTRYEVVHNFDLTVVYCTKGSCAYNASFTIANTGHRNQEEVTVTIIGLPTDLGGSLKTLNLSAAQPRSADPQVDRQSHDDMRIIRITEFTPGTLLEFTFMGIIPEEQLPIESKPTVKVSGKGKIIEGDPRAIALVRFVG